MDVCVLGVLMGVCVRIGVLMGVLMGVCIGVLMGVWCSGFSATQIYSMRMSYVAGDGLYSVFQDALGNTQLMRNELQGVCPLCSDRLCFSSCLALCLALYLTLCFSLCLALWLFI